MVEQHFCLRWNNYRTNITAEFEVLREGEHFVDVTLACDGRQLKAHKVVLSACSPYFKDLLQGNPCSHPIIILRDVGYLHMRGLLEFMYAGEVNVSQAQLAAFLRTAEALKVRGLAESPEPHASSVQAAAAAAAAAAVTNSVADLLALKSTMGSMPLVPLAAHHSSNSTSGTPPHHQHHHHESKAMMHAVQISNHAAAAVACAAAGIHNSAATTNNNTNTTALNSSCSDSVVNKSDMKSDFCESEPLPLTMNNNIEQQPKDRRSPSPHQSNKRLKCNHSSEGGSAPDSPHSASAAYYPPNTQSNGGSNSAASDIPGDDVAHDLSSASSKLQTPPRGMSITTTISSTKASTSPPANGSSSIAVTAASLPPSLAPSSSPEHLQYVFKSEPLESCGGGSDTEGACGGSWHEDSVGSDGEVLSGPASIGGPDNCSLPGGGNSDSTAAGGGNGSLPPALLPHHSGGGGSGTSASTGQHLHHSGSSPPPPPPPHHHHHHQQQQQQQQQQHPPHLMHAAMPPQESHLAGIMRSFEPLPCPICKRSYSSPGNLKQHIENIHMATTQPNFECRICNNKFKSKWYLHKHLHRAHHIRGRKEP